MKYQVIGIVDASIIRNIEADTPDAALDEFYNDCHVSICHQCSDKLDVGEVYFVRIIDNAGAGEQVYTDEQVDLSLATVEQLEAELEKRRDAELTPERIEKLFDLLAEGHRAAPAVEQRLMNLPPEKWVVRGVHAGCGGTFRQHWGGTECDACRALA